MITLRAAARLLARADSLQSLRSIAPILGFRAEPARINEKLLASLGIEGVTRQAELFEGEGHLRLITILLADPQSIDQAHNIRVQTKLVANALRKHAPTRQWCLCTLSHSRASLCIATVGNGTSESAISALIVDRSRVIDSDADTLCLLEQAASDNCHVRHARFSDILRRDALSMRFYRALDHHVDALAGSLSPSRQTSRRSRLSAIPRSHTPSDSERRELALLCASRLIFIGFLEAKGWMDERRNFLIHHLLNTLEAGQSLHQSLLRPLFFGTLNTPLRARAASARAFGKVPFLNGGLFSPTPLERFARNFTFSNDTITAFITNLLDRFRFTAREDSTSWSEAAVDPEMLGRAFEGLMAPNDRRRSGAFYTPSDIVNSAISETLTAILPSVPADLLCSSCTTGLPSSIASTVQACISKARVLDPACGSGAFLVRVLERFDSLLHRAGDSRPSDERRREILTRSIFGVDKDPMAVWLCELRLWLAVVIECNITDFRTIPPLPNLDHHIRIGDSLAGGSFAYIPHESRTLATLRSRYSRASGSRKATIAASLDHEERRKSIAVLTSRLNAVRHDRRTLIRALRNHDLFGRRPRTSAADTRSLANLRSQSREIAADIRRLQLGGALPFRFGAMFADIAASGGFDIIVGNPPWVRPHSLPERERQWLRREFHAMKHASWRRGAARAGAGPGFSTQPDIAVGFLERTTQLLRPGGIMAMLVPAKLWRTLSGGGIRSLLLQQTSIIALHDWSDAPAQFTAATYPSLIVASRISSSPPSHSHGQLLKNSTAQTAAPNGGFKRTSTIHVAVTRSGTREFPLHADTLSMDGSDDAPWLLLPPPQHSAFHAIRSAGQPLSLSHIGRPIMGVKCGCNSAFLVHATEHDDGEATVSSLNKDNPLQAVIERHLLRPALRGENIRLPAAVTSPVSPSDRDEHPEEDLRIIWTHGPDGKPLKTLPGATARWLNQWRHRLHSRTDVRNRMPWWSLFRTEAARSDCTRLVWADIGRRLRTRVLKAGDPTVPLNSCYLLMLANDAEAFALHALLQSDIVAAWLDVIAEPARGGFRRFMAWTVGSLPLPVSSEWNRAVSILAPLGESLHQLQDHLPDRFLHTSANNQQADPYRNHTTSRLLNDAVAEAYGLSPSRIEPLVEWFLHDR